MHDVRIFTPEGFARIFKSNPDLEPVRGIEYATNVDLGVTSACFFGAVDRAVGFSPGLVFGLDYEEGTEELDLEYEAHRFLTEQFGFRLPQLIAEGIVDGWDDRQYEDDQEEYFSTASTEDRAAPEYQAAYELARLTRELLVPGGWDA